jgi:hypothetical protein
MAKSGAGVVMVGPGLAWYDGRIKAEDAAKRESAVSMPRSPVLVSRRRESVTPPKDIPPTSGVSARSGLPSSDSLIFSGTVRKIGEDGDPADF